MSGLCLGRQKLWGWQTRGFIQEILTMVKKDARSEIRLTSDMDAAETGQKERLDPDRKFTVAVLGDLGAAAGSGAPLLQRRFIKVDRDNFDSVMERIGPRWEGVLALPLEGGTSEPRVTLVFGSVEDFHPDRIVRQIPSLRRVQSMLSRLGDPSALDEIESQLKAWICLPEKSAADPSAPPRGVDSSQLLDAMLEGGELPLPARPAERSDNLRRFVEKIVAPHAVRVDSGRQEALSTAIHGLLSGSVRSILHERAFQALESTWRSLFRLVRNADIGGEIQLRVLQVTKDEILGDITSGRELEESDLARLLLGAASVPGSDAPSVLVGDYYFSHMLEDLAVLERMGHLAARLRAPFIAGASPSIFGWQSFTDLGKPERPPTDFGGVAGKAWQLLRRSGPGHWIALALPRLLCRMPYGADSDPTETFQFEEGIAANDHDLLLWGNPAYAVAETYATAFEKYGWEMKPASEVQRLDGLPIYVYKESGETTVVPCAEALMTGAAAESLIKAGFLPILSRRGTDAVSMPSLQTIADPRAAIPL